MTIYKTAKTPTGVEVSHRVIHKLETTENFLEVKIGLRGYTSNTCKRMGTPPFWWT